MVAHDGGQIQLLEAGNHLMRLRTQAGNIAQAHKLIDAGVFEIGKHQIQCLEVAVNRSEERRVGKECRL